MPEEKSVDPRSQRRSERLHLSIPIRVFATSPSGRDFSENGITIIVSRHGGRIRLQSQLVVDDELYITNLTNKKEAKFRVVGRVGEPQEGTPFLDWGVECLEPEKGIWGVEFRDTPVDPAATQALLECCVCGGVSSLQIIDEEQDALKASGLITRSCPRCRQGTLWKYASPDRRQEALAAPTPAAAPTTQTTVPPSSGIRPEARPPTPATTPVPQASERRSGADRRQERRLALRMPMRLRAPDGSIEVTKTENFSKTGATFLSEKNYPVGTILFVAIPYTLGEEPIEAKAKVEEIESLPGSPARRYGIRIEGR